jgi:PAS domain S-box-containing protein
MPGRGETLFEELERYVRFSEADTEHLLAFHAIASPQFERIAQEFYERTREHAEAHAVFSGEEQIERLRRSLVKWMHRICVGVRDDAYYAETANIGRVHVRVGLPQRYVFTAMALIRVAFETIVDQSAMPPPQASLVRQTLARALDLELAIMLETYHDAFVARVQRVDKLERDDLGRALARSEHRYVNAIELAPYLVVGVDQAGLIRLFNREAERVSGYERDEVHGRSFDEVAFAEELRPEHAHHLRRAIEGEASKGPAFESVLRTRAHKTRSIRWQIAHAPSAHDDDVVAFAIGQDITDEKALAERTRQSEKLAAVGMLAAGLAHEIRNPLNGAHLHVTFLERGLRKAGADPEALEAVGVVGDEIKRLSVLVSEFLDFARPRPLQKKAISVQSLCERVVQLAAGAAESASVEVTLEMPAAELVIEADAAKLEQVLINLLHNAIEAMAPLGGGRARVRARRQPLVAVIEIEDEGPGLPGANAPVFDAFFTTKPEGTGLGLAIVHRIVTDHGGTITFESKPGKTIFRTELPIGSPSA